MRFIFVIAATLLISSCGIFDKNEDTGKAKSPKLADVQRRADLYVNELGDPYKHVARCDSLTFVGLFDASANVADILLHDYDLKADGGKTFLTGQIHRSKEPCNTNPGAEGPKMDSRSEVSKENVLSYFHNRFTYKDHDSMLRAIRRARDKNWCFAEGGDDGYNCMPEFGPLMNDIEKKLTGTFSLAEEADGIAIPKLEGYRGNVLHSYLLLKGRVFGYLRGAEVEAVKTLIATVPESPLYRITLHRFTDGDHRQVLKEMTSAAWPEFELPPGKHGDENVFQWEGGHKAMMYVWAAGVLSGI